VKTLEAVGETTAVVAIGTVAMMMWFARVGESSKGTPPIPWILKEWEGIGVSR
jgi:hypothetical protein